MNRFNVLLFARAKELAGGGIVEVELMEAATVGDLRRSLGEFHPKLAGLLPHCMFAIDDAYVADSFKLPTTAEIACIPPVSGG